VPDRMPRLAGEVKPRRSRLLWVGLPVFTVFAIFAVVVWLAYQENARLPTGEPPLVRAIAAPYKLAPEDPGGREIADQGEINALLRDEPRPTQPERVLPLPEEPREPIIVSPRAPAPPAGPAGTGDPAATVAAMPDASPGEPAPAPASEPEHRDATQEAQAALTRLLAGIDPAQTEQQPAAGQETATSPAAPEQLAAPAPDAVIAVPAMRPAAPPSTTAPTVIRDESPQVAAAVDAPSHEADEALTRLLAEVAGLPPDATPEPAAVGAPAAVAAIAPAGPADTGRQIGPGFRVQLAAVRDPEDARRAWADMVRRLGPLVADREPVYERADTVNGTFYRIQLGPFASEQAADRLCVEVQRRNASCFVVVP
jgi:hypothetical protein